MKIQINSLAALERLIGGDTDVEIEIRNSIVQEFAKKHLKCIANKVDDMLKKFVEELNAKTAQELLDERGDVWRELRKAVNEKVTDIAKDEIKYQECGLREDWIRTQNETIENVLQRQFNKNFIEDVVDRILKEKMMNFVKEEKQRDRVNTVRDK